MYVSSSLGILIYSLRFQAYDFQRVKNMNQVNK